MEFGPGRWYELGILGSSTPTVSQQDVGRLRSRAGELLDAYAAQHPPNGLMLRLLENGTFQDRMDATVSVCRESPLVALPYVERVVGLVRSPRPREVAAAVKAGTRCFIELLPDRALVGIAERGANGTERALVLMGYEDLLKGLYARFVQELEVATRATQIFIRDIGIRAVGLLLAAKPENERILLAILVDKFSSNQRSVIQVVEGVIMDVLRSHPAMVPSFAVAVKAARFTEEARRRALAFLSRLGPAEAEVFDAVAPKLVELLAGGEDSKMVRRLMRTVEKSVSRAAPAEVDRVEEALYSFVEGATISTAASCMSLLWRIKGQTVRFGEAFVRFLNKPGLDASAKVPLVLGIAGEFLGAAAEAEADFAIRTLLAVAVHAQAAVAAGVLSTIGTALAARPDLWEALAGEAKGEFAWSLLLLEQREDPVVRGLAADVAREGRCALEDDPFVAMAPAQVLRRLLQGPGDGVPTEFDRIEESPIPPSAVLEASTARRRRRKRHRSPHGGGEVLES